MHSNFVIGCDQHKKYCYMVVLNEQGHLVNQDKFYHNDPTRLDKFLASQPSGTRLVMEACGFDAWLADKIESHGIKVTLSHPGKTKAIAEAKIKTDKIDAKILAELFRANLIPEAYLPPYELREQRYLLRQRQNLVQHRTMVKNTIHSLLARIGIQTPELSDLFGAKGRAWLNQLELSSIYQQAIKTDLSLIDTLTQNIKEIEKTIKKLLKENESADLLMTIPGIGIIAAYLLLVEIGPIDRFPSDEKLCSYAGIVPKVYQSGKTRHTGSITKQGNKFIRWVLTEVAATAVRYDPHLKKFYDRIKFKKGNKKARVAAARKILTSVFHVLSKKEPYKFQL